MKNSFVGNTINKKGTFMKSYKVSDMRGSRPPSLSLNPHSKKPGKKEG
jgi:hypothetical protein